MLGFRYLKQPPNIYVALYKSGKAVREGAGLSFWYFSPTSEIVLIPLSSIGVPYVFNETTADFQEVSVQGEFTYRITEPKKLSTQLDYSVTPDGKYRTDDPQKLPERITHIAQKFARGFLQKLRLREALTSVEGLVETLGSQLPQAPALRELGVEVTQFNVISISARPEMAKALQAAAREQLLREADEAVYERRNNSVLLERTIKENELQTELVVQKRQREVQESQLAAEIALAETRLNADISRETERSKLVEQSSKNEQVAADARAYALRATLEPMRGLDWKTIFAMSGNDQSKSVISLAFQELAANAEKIQELSISPDLLNTLLRSND
ncbi:MAG: SPFH domain-containing protein [Pirellulales bacterium]|nr:SPFH domain-containing protein [Pirellulales bacterium]